MDAIDWIAVVVVIAGLIGCFVAWLGGDDRSEHQKAEDERGEEFAKGWDDKH